MRTLEDIMKCVPKSKYKDTDWKLENNEYNIVAKLSARCNFDFVFFCEAILGLKLSDFHKEIAPLLLNNRFILIEWPRGHLKTTMVSEAYTIWRLWRERNTETALVSSALEQSQKTIENIQWRIQDNEFLSELTPKDRNITWNKSQMNTAITHNRVFQKPFNSTSRGTHVDFAVFDDILREENITQEQIKDNFWSIFYPIVQTRMGQIILIGTPMTTKDLFADLIELSRLGKGGWKIIKRSAVIVDESGNWLKPIWPERFSLEELEIIRDEMGSLRFEREYMCNPLGGGADIFKNIRIGKHPELHKPLKTEEYYMGVDIAMQAGPKRDWLVFCILGKDRETGMIRQKKIERYQGWSEDLIIKRMEELHDVFNLKTIMIENVGLSVGIVKDLQNCEKYPELAKILGGSNAKRRGFVTNRKGKEELVSGIITGFDTNNLEILDNTLQYNELLAFKAKEDRNGKMTYEGVGEHDDMVMALGLAMAAIQSENRGRAHIEFI